MRTNDLSSIVRFSGASAASACAGIFMAIRTPRQDNVEDLGRAKLRLSRGWRVSLARTEPRPTRNAPRLFVLVTSNSCDPY